MVWKPEPYSVPAHFFNISVELRHHTPLKITGMDNEDMIYYLTDGDPETWKIAFYESRGEDVEVFDFAFTEFLCAALSRSIDAFGSGGSGGSGPIFTPSIAP